jgi:hypothetical protein
MAITFRRAVAPVAAQAAETAGEFLPEHGFDGRAEVHPQPLLDRAEPGLPGQQRKARTVCHPVHGVISPAVAAAGWAGVRSPGDHAAIEFPPTPGHDHDPLRLEDVLYPLPEIMLLVLSAARAVAGDLTGD